MQFTARLEVGDIMVGRDFILTNEFISIIDISKASLSMEIGRWVERLFGIRGTTCRYTVEMLGRG